MDGNIEIPNNVLVNCPAVGGRLVRVQERCDGCEHCAGLTQAYISPDIEFAKQYMLRCRFPVDREMVALDEGGA